MGWVLNQNVEIQNKIGLTKFKCKIVSLVNMINTILACLLPAKSGPAWGPVVPVWGPMAQLSEPTYIQTNREFTSIYVYDGVHMTCNASIIFLSST